MSNAIHLTIYDLGGAPLDPAIVKALEDTALALAQREKALAINIVRD